MSTTTVSIDFSALGIAFVPGTTYTVDMEADFVQETSTEAQPSPAIAGLATFITNSTGPVWTGNYPATATTVIDNNTMIIYYDRKIVKNTGQIKLYKAGATDTLINTYYITDSAITIDASGYYLTIPLSLYANEANTQYYFLIDAGIVKDYDGFSSPAINDSSTIRWTTGNATALTYLNPSNNATGFNKSNLQLTFDRNVRAGSGYIKLYNKTTSTLLNSFDVTSTDRISFSGNNCLITLGFILDADTNYYITVDNGAIIDTGGLKYPGFTNNSTFSFTTTTGVSNSSFRTIDLYSRSATTARLVITFPNATRPTATTANATNNTAGIQLWKVGTTDTLVHTFYNGKDSVGGQSGPYEALTSVNSIEVYCSTWLQQNQSYYLLIQSGAYYDSVSTLAIPAVTSKTAIAWDTNYGLLGTLTKTFDGNKAFTNFGQSLTNTVALNSSDDSLNYVKLLNQTTTYSLVLSSTIGKFTSDTDTGWATPYTITGTSDVINPALAVLKFWPNKNNTTNGTITVQLKSGTTTLSTDTITMTYSGTSATLDSYRTFVYSGMASGNTFTPTAELLTYYNTVDIVLVGAGGGGRKGGGGGGGGGIVQLTNQTLTNQTYTFSIASGTNNSSGNTGGNASNGASTTAFGQTAGGGLGATYATYTGTSQPGIGGASGTPQSNTATATPSRTPKNSYLLYQAALSTVQKRFGSQSLLLDGTGDSLMVDASTDFVFGTGDFTLEAWIYRSPTNLNSTYDSIFDFRNSSTVDGIWFAIGTDGLLFYQNGLTFKKAAGTTQVPASQWVHVYLYRTSGVVTIGWNTTAYLTPVSSTITDTNNYNTNTGNPLYIGGYLNSNGTQAFNGYIDEVRVSKGVSRGIISNPQTTAYTNDAYTVLLLHFESGLSDDYIGIVYGGGGGAGGNSTSYYGYGGVGLTSSIVGLTLAKGGDSDVSGQGDYTSGYTILSANPQSTDLSSQTGTRWRYSGNGGMGVTGSQYLPVAAIEGMVYIKMKSS